ncbi:type I restriction enzyme HsdR N-terminal domain-containing protein [Heliorestis acidaminivorans]|uniref:Type I restriction enzyme HsdR N-terminal domain-containing protein n=1 Tax=Heliorestis acidaminivorans TaxID=553427 RepID=A0A6I0F2T3_9FIRM|nr:type I restriction enzyme HsdR N-terminal domain-containing protein [Heliorestis acidaminivorans]KAB2952906.1 type I restriction enzyme HsdR N-terminal domain-containing protein [Heliorestis acidaminivorans]
MLIDIDKDLYEKPKLYLRNGQECLLDPIRQKFIQANPEEIVRQRVIQFLINEMSVPLNMIDTEVQLSKYKKGAKGRMDIVVYGVTESNLVEPVLIVECKAEDVPLTDKVFSQVFNYDEIVLADTVAVTDGNYIVFSSWDHEDKKYKGLEKLLQYQDLLKKGSIPLAKIEQVPWERPKFEDLQTDEVIEDFYMQGYIGEDTDQELYSFIINLACCLQDDSERLEDLNINGIKFIQDGGLRYTSYGDASGGNFPGIYRFFILEQNGSNQIVSINIFAVGKFEKDPTYGTRKGQTVLFVAIDDFEKSHASLHLSIDRHVEVNGHKYKIYHDGSLTAGRLGRAKNRDVIEYVKKHAPWLLDIENRIYLGEIDNSKEIRINNGDIKKFLGRIIEYSFIRDDFRKSMIKKNKGLYP